MAIIGFGGMQLTNNVFGRLHLAAKMHADRRTELCEQIAEKAGVRSQPDSFA